MKELRAAVELPGALLLTISSLGAIVSYEANLVQNFRTFQVLGLIAQTGKQQ